MLVGVIPAGIGLKGPQSGLVVSQFEIGNFSVQVGANPMLASQRGKKIVAPAVTIIYPW
jgi:hypothetical protein